MPLDKDELPGPLLDLSGEIKKSGLSAIVMTFATNYKRNVQPGEAFERFINGLTAMDKALSGNKIKRAFTLADIETAHKQHQPIVIQAIECIILFTGYLFCRDNLTGQQRLIEACVRAHDLLSRTQTFGK